MRTLTSTALARHYELGINARHHPCVAAAFTELADVI